MRWQTSFWAQLALGDVMTGEATSKVPRLDTIHFNSTKTCNLGCAFCYDKAVRGRTENLPIETVRELADDALGLGARRVILSGGEPLTRKDWAEIARTFDAAGMEVSLATNGTLIDDEVVDVLCGLKRTSISISLDGDEAVHDRLRAQPGAHRRTIRGLEALRAAQLPFDINATLFRDNLSEVPFLTKLCRDFDCNVRLSLLHPNGRGSEMNDVVLKTDDILRLREYCHILRDKGLKIFINLPPLLQYMEEIIPGRGSACGWAVNFCGVLSNGDVTICGVASDEPSLVAGNIRERRFRDIWASAAVFRATRSLDTHNLQGVCGRCPFNEFCGGACRLSAYRAAGDFLAPYELCQRFYDEGHIPEEVLEPAGSSPMPQKPKVARLPVLRQ